MPALKHLVTPLELRSLPDVTTSDHKPVACRFRIQLPAARGAETPRSTRSRKGVGASVMAAPRQSSPHTRSTGSSSTSDLSVSGRARPLSTRTRRLRDAPLVRVSSLELTGLRDADLGGGSDPYCIFYTNPHGLLSDDRRAHVLRLGAHRMPHSALFYVPALPAHTRGGVLMRPRHFCRTWRRGGVCRPAPHAGTRQFRASSRPGRASSRIPIRPRREAARN